VKVLGNLLLFTIKYLFSAMAQLIPQSDVPARNLKFKVPERDQLAVQACQLFSFKFFQLINPLNPSVIVFGYRFESRCSHGISM